jgi:hypothetical protein
VWAVLASTLRQQDLPDVTIIAEDAEQHIAS